MMKYILLTLCLLINAKCFATMQTPDILIINKDTTFMLYNYPLNNHPNIEKIYKYMEGDTSFLKSSSTGCWRGYIAEWILINNTLHLSNIYSCDREIKLNLKEIFKNVNKDGLVKADWVSGKYEIAFGKFYPNPTVLRQNYSYEYQSNLSFESGICLKRIDYDNSKSIITKLSYPYKLEEYIYQNIDWQIFKELKDDIVIKMEYRCDSLGYVTQMNFNRNTNYDIQYEISRILKNTPIEAIYYYGKFEPYTYWTYLKFNNDNRLKYKINSN